MKSLDLFSGAGGLTLGFRNAGIHSIGAIELDRFAAETFHYNFPEIPLFNRDIYSFSEKEAGVKLRLTYELPFPTNKLSWPIFIRVTFFWNRR